MQSSRAADSNGIPSLNSQDLPLPSPAANPWERHELALQAIGQKVFLDRLETGKQICLLMLIASLTAIPVHFMLFILSIPYDTDPGKVVGIAVLLPGIIFLAAALAFAWGLIPAKTSYALSFSDQIETVCRTIIARRNRLIVVGLSCFGLACLISMAVIVKGHL